MKILVLVRHAKSSWNIEGLDDIAALERELNEEKRLHLLTLDVLKDTEKRRREQEAEIEDLRSALTLAKSFMLTDENDTTSQTRG